MTPTEKIGAREFWIKMTQRSPYILNGDCHIDEVHNAYLVDDVPMLKVIGVEHYDQLQKELDEREKQAVAIWDKWNDCAGENIRLKNENQKLRALVEKADELWQQIPYASREGEFRKQWQSAKKEAGLDPLK